MTTSTSFSFVDSHAHLSGETLAAQADNLLARAQLAGIKKIVNICTDIPSLEKGLKLAQLYPWVYNTAATTPHDVEKEGELVFPVIAQHARQGDLIAVGETGLDYYYEHSPKELQKHFLIKYFQLALECKLPVVIHCREAFADFFDLADAVYSGAPGVLHCFTGNWEEAKKLLDRGWYISFSGIVTFKKSAQLREVAKNVPLEYLLIETDSPFLAPQSHRGKVNEPAYLPETAALIAELKNRPLEEIANSSSSNAERLFRFH